LDMGEPVRILDIAERLIERSGRPDISIEFTGLRPGEKLHEDLFGLDENAAPSAHPSISITRCELTDVSIVDDLLATPSEFATRALEAYFRLPQSAEPDLSDAHAAHGAFES
jgi:FlaA1/EpsC-like NDP-sugar epimerase